MSNKFHHFGVTVSDMNEALAFYRDALGLDVDNEISLASEEFRTFVGVEDATADIRFLDAETCAIELLEYTRPDGDEANAGVMANDVGASHICLAVDDIDEAYDNLKGEYEVVSTPQTLDNGARVVNVYDPDDNVVQLIEP
jgi:catechol 2,3-dioxygenase-like lactoylglutathione lyase family enzyme